MENQIKVALVTGASRGIGRATALELAKKGYTVVINYSGNKEAADKVQNEIEKEGGHSVTIQGNVGSSEDVDRIFSEIKEKFGRLDLLVNNAGITRDSLTIRMKEKQWDEVITTNLKGVFLTAKAAASIMLKQRSGVIINVASIVGIVGNIGQANYSAAKGGVISMTKTMAKEFASRGVRVNAVAPGFVETDMTEILPEKIKENMLNSIPLGRMGKAQEIANAISFLASDDASYITGQILQVDGGMVM